MQLANLKSKFNEALSSVLPIVAIVLLLALTVAPMPNDMLLAFLFGGFLLIVGMMLFSAGAELSMSPMGEYIGAKMTKTAKVGIIAAVCFALGMLITVSEPDLQVLADQVASIPDNVLIFSVAAGVGLFLVVAVLRMLVSFSLKAVLIISYAVIFVLVLFSQADFLTVAFDSGGVTTGPMTVPFIMAFGIGICAVRRDRNASNDSFGLVAICSAGPVIAVLILSIVYKPGCGEYVLSFVPSTEYSAELGWLFLAALPEYIMKIAHALLPIVGAFAVFQFFTLKLGKEVLIKIFIGLVYTYAGLVIFLTGVNVGFVPVGSYLGTALASFEHKWVIVPVGMLIGYFIVKAEPAVHVLMVQVEEITNGRITGKALQISLSCGVAFSVGLSMLRVLTGIPVMYFLVPGYALAVVLSFFVPDIFTAVAFDSGGVASGPMTAAFLLPLAVGACSALGGNIVKDAFGVVALVTMTPLVAIQILGLADVLISRKTKPASTQHADVCDEDRYAVIEL